MRVLPVERPIELTGTPIYFDNPPAQDPTSTVEILITTCPVCDFYVRPIRGMSTELDENNTFRDTKTLCEMCHSEIDPRELEAVPWAKITREYRSAPPVLQTEELVMLFIEHLQEESTTLEDFYSLLLENGEGEVTDWMTMLYPYINMGLRMYKLEELHSPFGTLRSALRSGAVGSGFDTPLFGDINDYPLVVYTDPNEGVLDEDEAEFDSRVSGSVSAYPRAPRGTYIGKPGHPNVTTTVLGRKVHSDVEEKDFEIEEEPEHEAKGILLTLKQIVKHTKKKKAAASKAVTKGATPKVAEKEAGKTGKTGRAAVKNLTILTSIPPKPTTDPEPTTVLISTLVPADELLDTSGPDLGTAPEGE